MTKTKHLGSDFDDFLEKENLDVEAEAIAVKRVITHAIQQEMLKRDLTKKAMAAKLQTSRSALDRLLDPENTFGCISSFELFTMNRFNFKTVISTLKRGSSQPKGNPFSCSQPV